MRILVNVRDLEIGVTPLEELQEGLIRFLRGLYDDSADDDEAYLIDEWDEATLGRDNPKAIVTEASAWNDRLRDDFESAFKPFYERKIATGQLPVNDAFTYVVRKAAMSLDNAFYAYSDYAVGLPIDAPVRLRTVLSDSDLVYVQAHPEEFAIIDISAK